MKKTVFIFTSICMMVFCNTKSYSSNYSEKGLCTYNDAQKTFQIEQNGHLLTMKGSKLIGNGNDPSYNRTYVVQDNYLVFQEPYYLYVLHFDEQGEVVSEFSIRDQNNNDTEVGLYKNVAIKASLLRDTTRMYNWTYGISYVDVNTQEIQTVNLLKSFGNQYGNSKFVADIINLTVFGNTFYVLANIENLQDKDHRILNAFLLEYNLDKRIEVADRITPIDVSSQPIKVEKEENKQVNHADSVSSIVPNRVLTSLRSVKRDDSPTMWSPLCIDSSDKYLIVAFQSQTSVFMGESIGGMTFGGMGYLVYDRKTMRKIAFYPLQQPLDPYSAISTQDNKIYMFDWSSCSLHALDIENPSVKKTEKSDFPSFKGLINSYPKVGLDVVKAGYADSIVAKGVKAHRSHFSVNNGKLFYIAEDKYGKSYIDSLKIQE